MQFVLVFIFSYIFCFKKRSLAGQLPHCPSGRIVALIFVAVISSIAAAGTPGTTLLIVAGFGVAHVPLAGLPLLFSVDRFFDMIATSFNTLGNTLGTVVINRISLLFKDQKK